ncbi:response regulator transcription factor [Persicitalea jodogahamensis]|uniref:HTH luxR-type domain-containing protein n=1 Tax=Persicitalea jodogahamensis TaxID=402147 RepID=A0A8J3GAW5_9BACT|nr:helix-turn-helix transcriptional regulator [Persicitalea jodogahamensis]GHB86233.1 hypothetical protein GCM10007390_47140 [Persicitalea jodogahamensis]
MENLETEPPLNGIVSEIEKNIHIFEINMSLFKLTTREKQVVRLVRLGKMYKETAEELHIVERTVKKHVENIFQKAAVTNKAELLHKMMQNH